MTESYDKEIEAIGVCLNALGPLDAAARNAVLSYVAKRLQMAIPELDTTAKDVPDVTPPSEPLPRVATSEDECHITALVDEKQPRTAIEMAVLVAYYLSHRAPKSERKPTISTDDLTTYFKIAEFRLPKSPQYTLPNTKNAGYLDSAGGGQYKLNPVGYNLVVHSMPKANKADRPAKGRPATQKSRRSKPKASKPKDKQA